MKFDEVKAKQELIDDVYKIAEPWQYAVYSFGLIFAGNHLIAKEEFKYSFAKASLVSVIIGLYATLDAATHKERLHISPRDKRAFDLDY